MREKSRSSKILDIGRHIAAVRDDGHGGSENIHTDAHDNAFAVEGLEHYPAQLSGVAHHVVRLFDADCIGINAEAFD